jgi:hypothetical protein
MSVVREVASELCKMFVGDAWLTGGILIVVSLTAGLVGYRVVPPLIGGAILFLGCCVVLVASVARSARGHRVR